MNVVTIIFPKAEIAIRAGSARLALSFPENTCQDGRLVSHWWRCRNQVDGSVAGGSYLVDED